LAAKQPKARRRGQVHRSEHSRVPLEFSLDEDENDISILGSQQVSETVNDLLLLSANEYRRTGPPEQPTDAQIQNSGHTISASCATQSANRKRTFSSLQEPVCDTRQQSSTSKLPNFQQEFFGYVTSQGEYRCALCMSQLKSQEALHQHESMSKLHLRNLQDPTLVSRGRAKLNLVTCAANTLPVRPALDTNSHASSSSHHINQNSLGETSPLLSLDRGVRNGKRRAYSILSRQHQNQNTTVPPHLNQSLQTTTGSDLGTMQNNVKASKSKADVLEAAPLKLVAETLLSVRNALTECCESYPEVFGNAVHEASADDMTPEAEYIDTSRMNTVASHRFTATRPEVFEPTKISRFERTVATNGNKQVRGSLTKKICVESREKDTAKDITVIDLE
jgi:hypothetical protein